MASPVVQVQQGFIQGEVGEDFDGGKFYKFLGIPFAKPPLGSLRFKDPVPPDSWSGIRDGTKEGGVCFSKNVFIQQFEGSEDCLYLNVFTKELPEESDKPKPVMVWIHGGGFVIGSASPSFYGPEFLLTEDIVLVTLNYRLGMLGFIRLKDSSLGVTGNVGLKDQVAALRWVKNNIESFNGDPKNITIFGESAGAVSVHYHVLSPMSRDLFHKAIIQSGVALNNWAVCDHDAVEVAKKIDSTISDEKQALELFRSLSLEQLHEIQSQYEREKQALDLYTWGPVIEKATNSKPAFISKHPIDLIREGDYSKVPMIFGYTNKEGMILDFYKKIDPEAIKNYPENQALPTNIGIPRNSEAYKNILKKIQNVYFQGKDNDDNLRNLITDKNFLAGTMASIKNHLDTSPYPIYLYRMSVETELNLLKHLAGLGKLFGACHGDELGYLFKSFATPPIRPDSLEEKSMKRFVKLWTNFAKFGNPTPEYHTIDNVVWKKVMKSHVNFLEIGFELGLEFNPEPSRMALWREIYHLSDKKYF